MKYEDQKSLFDTFTRRQTEYIYGHIQTDKPDIEIIDNFDKVDQWKLDDAYGLPLFGINLQNRHEEFL